jgi:hypothetical protein
MIVNLASTAGLVGSTQDPLYSMTKDGVTLFSGARHRRRNGAADGRGGRQDRDQRRARRERGLETARGLGEMGLYIDQPGIEIGLQSNVQ